VVSHLHFVAMSALSLIFRPSGFLYHTSRNIAFIVVPSSISLSVLRLPFKPLSTSSIHFSVSPRISYGVALILLSEIISFI
jgi:hypothetical protein